MTPEIFKHPAFVPGVVIHIKGETWEDLGQLDEIDGDFIILDGRQYSKKGIASLSILSGPWSLWNHAPSWAEFLMRFDDWGLCWYEDEEHLPKGMMAFMRRPPWLPQVTSGDLAVKE
jgi:hypothetical protein